MDCPSEALLQAFAEGELASAEVASLSTHLDECAACRALVGAIQPVRDDASDRIGRYLLRRKLGQGGMGVVYEAFDPQLGRVVAVKLLHHRLASPALQERLVAEARAMARLSHANVVPVHDIGSAGDQVFIVMDLVAGTSLRTWLASPARSAAEVLAVFRSAGEGLAAAHEAGLVHRDFKPENVLLSADGRVTVSDFGLAISDAAVLDPESVAGEGSPAYMAPEQKSGAGLDARSDQFSFCLALHEAFRDEKVTSDVRPRMPRWLRPVLARGLSEAPERRYPSMRALLSAMDRGARRRRLGRAAAIGAVVVALSGGLTFWAGVRRQASSQRCGGAAARLQPMWNAEIAARVKDAFARTGGPLAAGEGKALQALEAYARSWREAHRQSCEATRVRGEQSEAALDKQMSCLSERLELLGAVARQLERLDASTIERVPMLLQLLTPVGACTTLNDRTPSMPPPSEHLAEVEAARRSLASSAARLAAGRYDEGLALAEEGVKQAAQSGYLPARAEASLWVGTSLGRLGRAREAETALEQAASSASAAHAELTAVRAWIQLLHFVGVEARRYDDGLRYGEYAETALRSMPSVPELEAERLSWLSAIYVARRQYDDALGASRRQLSLVETHFGHEHLFYAAALDGIAGVLAAQGSTRDAIEPQSRACDALRDLVGAPHPQLALCLNNLAALHANLGEHDAAITLKREALGMYAQLPGHPAHVAMAHRNLARSYVETGQLREAEAELDAAAQSPTPAGDLILLRLRGEILRRRHRSAEAVAVHTQLVEKAKSADQARQLDALLALAQSQYEAKRDAEAAETAVHALALAEALYGATSFRLAEPLQLKAQALLRLGRVDEAHALASRSLQLLTKAQVDPALVDRAQSLLAGKRASTTKK